uniref:Uncharacterized protein n=1 Tax=Schlesneria paludicola TaxID=360056 RepID=A0A7C4LKH5_9PLAN
MASVFFRLDTELRATPVPLEHLFAGPQRSACWMIGGGPSLNDLPTDEIARSPLPKMCLNLAGTHKLRPNFWTAYDPTARFLRSLYLDPGVLKFVHRRRALDLVPETRFKVCECPGLLCFDRDPRRGFADLLSPQAAGIVDWADTFVQALDILFRLGFRTIYLAGCELCVRPAEPHLARAAEVGCTYHPAELLGEFVARCVSRGLTVSELERLAPWPQYHFEEHKPLAAAIQTDRHYHRIVQCLRLSRACLVRHGLELVSVTPHSRLNDDFPYRPVQDVLRDIAATVGDPARESTRGCYTNAASRQSAAGTGMLDCLPPRRSAASAALRTASLSRYRRRAPCQAGDPAASAPADRLSFGENSLPAAADDLVVQAEGWSAE